MYLYNFILSGPGRSDSSYASVKLNGPHFQYEEVKLESNPAYVEATKPTFTNEPQYEECGRGVTNNGDVAMEENPAYQSVGTAHSTKAEEPTNQNA